MTKPDQIRLLLLKKQVEKLLYHSEEINGVANSDEDGNLIVLYMDEVLNDAEIFTC